jgi:hypothetical protein
MELNNILIDILDWIRKLAWGRQNKEEYTPYKVLTMEKTSFGLLKRVTRDTPRAVSTYILTPFAPPKYSKEPYNDYHFCLDYLGKIQEHKSFKLTPKSSKPVYDKYTVLTRGNNKYSHCITILRANRWPNSQGNYSSKVIYQGYYDLVGSQWQYYRDRWANVIFQDMVNHVKHKDISLLKFNDIIEQSRQRYLGTYYKPNSGIYYTDIE